MNNTIFSYAGLFLDKEELHEKLKTVKRRPLEIEYPVPHITFAYHPVTINESLFGEAAQVVVVGYGRNQDNEGLKVIVQSDSQQLMQEYHTIPIPHVTLSLSPEGSAVDTGKLSFQDIIPFSLTAVYGGYWKARGIVVTTTDPLWNK